MRELRRSGGVAQEAIVVMESAEHGRGDDASAVGNLVPVRLRLCGKIVGRLGKAGSERGVRAPAVVEAFELYESPADVVLGKRNHEIETLTTEGPDEPFAESVRLWSLGRCLDHFDTEVLDLLPDIGSEQNVSVEHEEAVGMLGGNGFTELLGRPGPGGN